jgi:hypothetical protein
MGQAMLFLVTIVAVNLVVAALISCLLRFGLLSLIGGLIKIGVMSTANLCAYRLIYHGLNRSIRDKDLSHHRFSAETQFWISLAPIISCSVGGSSLVRIRWPSALTA